MRSCDIRGYDSVDAAKDVSNFMAENSTGDKVYDNIAVDGSHVRVEIGPGDGDDNKSKDLSRYGYSHEANNTSDFGACVAQNVSGDSCRKRDIGGEKPKGTGEGPRTEPNYTLKKDVPGSGMQDSEYEMDNNPKLTSCLDK